MKQKRTKPAKHSRLRQNARLALLAHILSGELKAGAKVNESRLAGQLKVSRTPLREALLQLEHEGFIRSDLRRGFTVQPLAVREAREIYPMMAVLESLALRSSAAFAHLIVPELLRVNAELEKTRDPVRALELDARWHEILISQSQNRRLADTIASLRLAIRRYERVYMSDTRLVSASAAKHVEIIKALKKRDVNAAVKALEENWLFDKQVLMRKMGEE